MSGVRAARSDSLTLLRRAPDMGRADRARRERPSRRLKRRPRPTAGPDAPCSPSFFARLARLAPAAGLPWACLALALAVSGALPSPARAQTDVTLVSNFDDVSSSSGIAVGESGSLVYVAAQQFTTGADTQGYVLKTLKFSIRSISSTGASLKASIYTSVNDKPGTELYSFDSPSSGAGEKTVSAQNNATLTANTSYFVVFEDTDTTTGRGSMFQSKSFNSYDTDSLTDWSLAGWSHSSDGGTTWGSISTTQKMAIKLVGEVVGTTTTNTAPTLENDIENQEAFPGMPFTFQFPEDTFDDADGDPLTYTATLGNGDDLPSWLDFTASTRTFSGTPMASDVGRLTVKVTASDGSESVYDKFELAVKPSSAAVLQKLEVREEPDGTVAKNTFIPPRGTYTPRLEQTASVSHDTETVTIIAEGEEPNATIEYRRADGGAIIEDADTNKDHHQVELWSYANPMEITLTSTVGSDTVSKTYTLRIRRAGSTTQEAATGKPVISGEPRVGETLTVDTSKVTDANGTYRAETGFLQHEFRVNWHVVDEDPDTNITEIIGTGKTITLNENHKGKLLYVNMVFKDDLGNDESVTSERTDRVKGYELVISTTGGRLTGSRCDYVYPAGVHCDGETTPRDVGEPLTVLSEGGADMAEWVTAFHIENPTTVGVFDEYGNEQEASYEFEITPSGQVRTVQGRTYPHFEFPYCEPVSGVCRTSKNAFKFFMLTSVDVKVTVETFDGRIGKGSFPVWVVAHPDARSVTGTETSNRRCGKNNNWRCYGRMLVDGQQMYGPVVTRTVPKSTVPKSQALSASFEDAPARHDGQSSFKLSLVFSEAPHERNNRELKSIVSVRNGTVTKVRRIDKDKARRRLTIEPNGNAAVHVSVPRTTDCAAATALCTAAGGRLETGASITVPAGPQASVPSVAPLTVEFTNAPVEHDGSSEFTFEIVFSERPDGVDNEDIRAALAVSGGTKTGLRRVDGDYTHRRAKVRPDGYGAVTATLPATGDCADATALCTAAGGKLETPVTVTVEGPVAISVADARVEEAEGAKLVFAVTLDRARHDTVTVDYATEDGSADVDDDYTETEGTLTFAAGETSKEVEVLVRDDAHDEGEETMVLRLSNPVGARIADGEATGTIENTDHMPRAWLGRFGRTVADQVLDAVEGRMRAPRAPGAEVRLAGQRLGLGLVFGTEAAPEGGEEAAALRAWEAEAEAAQAGRRLAAWLEGAADEEDRSGRETRTVSGRALLLGSSFSLTAGAADGAGGSASLWGRSAVSRFDAREGELSLDGEVASGLLGADWARGRWTAGLVVSHSRGEGGYRASSRSERHFEASSRSERNPGEGGAGTVSSTLTGLYPWGRHALSERVSVWGVAGYGEGTLTLTPEGDDGERLAAIRTDMDLAMGAVGVRGVAVAAPSDGGVELSVTSDALGVRTTSDAVRGGTGNLAATEADVTRLRLGLEGTWRGLAVGTGTLEPRLELGARHDGGDAETGFGVDAGGGVVWSDPARGVRAELGGRGLLTHESAGFADRGFAASLVFDPAPGSDRGPSLTLARTVGASATGGMDALLRPETARALGAAEEDALARRRFEARLGYGFAVLGGGWTGVPELGLGWSESARETVFGARLLEARGAGLAFGLDVEGRRRESVVGGEAAPEHRLGLGFGWRLEGARRGSFEGARVEPGDEAPGHEVGLRLTARW